jgi:hypothetical protein
MPRKGYIRCLLLIGAIIGSVAGGLQISGGGATPSSAASVQPPASDVLPTIPAQSPTEIQRIAEKGPPVTEAPPTGPELSLSEIRQIALKYARLANNADPSVISVAQGSFASARAVVEANVDTNAPSGSDKLPWSANSTYLVVMHGNFTLDNVPIPPGHPSPTGTVMGLILDAHTGFPEGRYVGPTTPDLQMLGPVIQLAESH